MKYLIVTILFASFFISCSKSNDENPPAGENWYIQILTRVGLEYFDELSNESDTSINFYTYASNKITHKSIYKDFGYVDSTQYSFYYDPSGNILKYENDWYTDDPYGEIQKINFTYSNNRVSEAYVNFFGGDISIQQFWYSADGRTVIVYDTLPSSTPFEEYEEYRYYFSADNKLDSQVLISPYGNEVTKFQYDASGNIIEINEDGHVTTFSSRDNRGGEVSKTYHKILSNVWYHYFMNVNTNDALIFNNATGSIFSLNVKFPATSVTNSWGVYSITNTYNNNRLISQMLPDNVGSKAYGPSKVTFSYVNVP